MISKYCGDCNNTDSHALHKIKITKPQAELIAKLICENYHISVPKVVFTGRKTKRNLGHYFRGAGMIQLQAHPEGESVGCMIHELSHHVAVKQFTGVGKLQSHGFEFKNTQRMLLQYVKTHAEELNIPGLENVFVTFNRHVAKQLTAAPIDTRPVLTITAPTVIKIPKPTDNLMNSRNLAILDILKAAYPKRLIKADIGNLVNEVLKINRNSWDTPLYELKKAGIIDYNPADKTYQMTGGK